MFNSTPYIFSSLKATDFICKGYSIETGKKWVPVVKTLTDDNGMKKIYRPCCVDDLDEASKDFQYHQVNL